MRGAIARLIAVIRPKMPGPRSSEVDGAPRSARRSGDLRIVAISRILDEADIVEAFVRHTAAYAGHHVFLDNGSRDGTLDILRALKDEGLGITVFGNDSVSFNETEHMTALFRHAVSACGADWVLCLDADEFVDDRSVAGGLATALEREMRDYPDSHCLKVQMIEYERAPDDDERELVVPLRLRRRGPLIDTFKVFVRAELARPDTQVSDGNHAVIRDGNEVPCRSVPGLRLAHYPRRSPYQMAAKCAKGWAKVLATGTKAVGSGVSLHYRGHFNLFRDRPRSYFRNPDWMGPREVHRALTLDPIAYRGGPLRYSSQTDEAMRGLSAMMGYLDALAQSHGRLIDEVPEARRRVEAWNGDLKRIL